MASCCFLFDLTYDLPVLYSHSSKSGGENVCCSRMYEYLFTVDKHDANSVGEHFRKSHEAMAKIGFSIQLGIIHQEDWGPSAVAKAWWAAAGRDMDLFREWMTDDDGPILVKLDNAGKQQVVDIVFELPD